MSRRYWWFNFIMCGLLISMYGLAQAAPIKIGSVDMQRVIKESIAGKEKLKQGNQIIQKKKSEISNLEGEINKMFNEFKEKAMVLSPEAKKETRDKIENKMIEIKRFEKDLVRRIRKLEKESIGAIVSEVNKIIQQIAKQEGFSLILDSTGEQKEDRSPLLSNVLYIKPELDITDKIIELYDKQHESGQGKK